MNDAQPQQYYQIRFDCGLAGFQSLAAGADVIILADALPAIDDEHVYSTLLAGHRVIAANLNNRAAVADWVLARQAEKGGRFAVAVIAVGERRHDGGFRVAVEDLLVAGAVIDRLSTLGLDHCSPEAAAASAGFTGLKQALKHLIGASETGRMLVEQGRTQDVQAASLLDESGEVVTLEEFVFPA